MFDYRLYYLASSIADDRRARHQAARGDKRIYQLPARRADRAGGRR
jgi:hypothetical protein